MRHGDTRQRPTDSRTCNMLHMLHMRMCMLTSARTTITYNARTITAQDLVTSTSRTTRERTRARWLAAQTWYRPLLLRRGACTRTESRGELVYAENAIPILVERFKGVDHPFCRLLVQRVAILSWTHQNSYQLLL